MAFFGRKSPLEALVMPAVFKYRQIRERRREAQSKKVTEKELNALHNKIVSIRKLKKSFKRFTKNLSFYGIVGFGKEVYIFI